MYLAPIRTNATATRVNDFQVDLDVLSESYRTEQKEYYLSTSAWADVHPSQLLGPGICFKKYDLLTITIDELKADLITQVSLPLVDGGPVDAFCGWFDVTFKGSPEHPADEVVKLPTAPDATGSTHWGQQVFLVHPPIDCAPNDSLSVKLHISRRTDNHRLLQVALDVKVEGKSMYAAEGSTRMLKWNVD
eukprot:gene191-383_t